MSNLEKMEKYIENTPMKHKDLYSLRLGEIMALYDAGNKELLRMVCLAFDYGMAKGYRMAKKEKLQEV